MFNDTVANNITFGLENVPRAEVERAARIANAHDFIMEMEDGYETNIGDRGEKRQADRKTASGYSTGGPEESTHLILDEATSALDSESEKMVQDA